MNVEPRAKREDQVFVLGFARDHLGIGTGEVYVENCVTGIRNEHLPDVGHCGRFAHELPPPDGVAYEYDDDE